MITISETAKSRVISLMSEEDKNPVDYFLRVSVEGGGCSGLSYKMSIDKDLTDDDKMFEDKGVRLVVNKKSFVYLVGTELDFSGGLNGKGFSFNNPNATRSCSCGESFAV